MNVIMPQLGETVLEGSVANWYKKVGDFIETDETLFDVETEKVTSEIPTPIAGVLKEILVPVGTTVKVGTVLAIIEAKGSTTETKLTSMSGDSTSSVDKPTITNSAALESQGQVRSVENQARLSPVVRRLLGENGLSPEQVTGTGNNGRITREDVLTYLASTPSRSGKPAVPTQSGLARPLPDISTEKDDLVLPLNKIRRATANHMVRSKATAPHAVQAVEVDFHAVDKARQMVGKEWKKSKGYSLTYMPFIARAVCEALGKYPYINSSFNNDELIVHKCVHLGVAVDVNFEGLLVTVMRNANHHNLRGLATEINRLAAAARKNQLKPDELAGGTYTISNSGTFGTLFSISIINQPQAAILSVDGVRKKPVVIEGPDGDVIAIRPMGILAQSFDHRAFDGAYSASFLHYLKEIIEGRNWLHEI